MPESRSHFKWDFWTFVIIGVLGVFMLFLIYPLFTLFLSGFQDPYTGRFSMVNFAKFFHKRYYYRSLFNSFKVTTAVTLLAVLIGTPMAWFMSSFRIRAKRLLDVLIIISMLSPPFIGAYSWILLCGRSGVVTQTLSKVFNCEWPSIYGFGGILLVLTLKLYPFIYLYVSGALKKIDSSLSEAAESLGCSGARKVVTVVMPLIMPTLLAGALMVFMNALADFGTPMLIGEGYSTMPVQIYSEFISEVGETANFPAAMSVIMVLVTTVIFSLQKYIINRKSFVMSSLRPMHAKEISGFKSLLVHGYIWLVVALSLVPQVTVIYTSFLKTRGQIFIPGYSFDSYRAVFSTMISSVKNSFEFGLSAIAAIIVLGMLIAYLTTRRKSAITNFIDSLTMLPYVIPGSVLGITLLLAFNKKPLLLTGTAIIMIVSLVIRRLPYTLRSSSAILYQISPSIEEASISLGCSPARTFWRVTAIMMLPGVLSGAILSWITVLNELSSSVILYGGDTKTMSVAIYSEVIRASYGTAAALSTLLTIATVASLLVFFKLSGAKDVSL